VAERTVSITLSMAYSAMFRVNWPDSILAMSSTVTVLVWEKVKALPQ
jgi:hypothetical protein